MYSILLVSRDEMFRNAAGRFIPRIDHNFDLHVANSSEAAIAALNQTRIIELIAYDHDEDNNVLEFLDLADRSRLDLPVIVVSRTSDTVLDEQLINRHVDGFIRRGGKDATDFFMDLCKMLTMAAERRRNENEHRTNERRMEAMIEMAKMDQSDFQSVVDYALERCIEVTGSEIGYVSAYVKEENKLRMLAWSHTAMKSCAVSNYPVEFDLDTTGIWGEPIRLGRTVTVNDYNNDRRAMKKGTPTGHVGLGRLLMIPITVDGVIIGTAGVGNKPTEYTWSDEKQLKMMMTDLFEIHRKIETSKRQSFHMDAISRFLETGPIGIIFTDADLDIILINDIAKIVIGADDMPKHFRLDEVQTTQAKDVIKQINEVRKSGSQQRSRILMSEDKMDLAFECFVQMSAIDRNRNGFMILFNDISDLLMLDSDIDRTGNHISVLEGPVLNAMIKASSELDPGMSSYGSWVRLRSAIMFMDDYRLVEKNRATWMRLDSTVDKASRAAALGGVELVIKTLGIEIHADPAFPLVFKHLFNNSVEHGGMVTRIEIRCRITRGNMTIVYQDDGSGIPDDIRGKIFDLASEGRFGMFLVKSILDSCGFSIRCPRSENGALFEIDVPPESYSLD